MTDMQKALMIIWSMVFVIVWAFNCITWYADPFDAKLINKIITIAPFIILAIVTVLAFVNRW